MAAVIDIKGQRFGRLVVLEFSEIRDRGAHWKCQCDCGKVVVCRSNSLRRGLTRSCGCFRLDQVAATCTTHGGSTFPEYIVWHDMKARCYTESSTGYEHYGARGITVCDRWRDSFNAFYQDMGEKPTPRHTLERIEQDGNYEPGNCRWATMAEQSRNKRNNRFYEINGKKLVLKDVAKELNIPFATLMSRINRGRSFDDAINFKRKP